MLVLTRRTEEQIVIGEVVVTVVAVGSGRVRLGIEAPPEVVVRRAELPPDFPAVAITVRHRLARTPTRKGRNPC